MLFAISGSQGSGKTTTLNALKGRGFNVIERKTSRSILADWNVTLEQVNSDHDLTIKFQEEIITRKSNDEKDALDSKDVWLTERSYADLFTYAVVTLGKDDKFSSWLDQYYETCKKLQEQYSLVFYLKAGMFDVEHDGVRGSNKHYSRMIDATMEDITRSMSTEVIAIQTSMLQTRANFIESDIDDFLDDLEYYGKNNNDK